MTIYIILAIAVLGILFCLFGGNRSIARSNGIGDSNSRGWARGQYGDYGG